ncbi:MAG: HEPN domain-containing protein [Actinomycetota bacterium]
MRFDWLQYLHLAKELATQGMTEEHQEAKLRTAIHLAYYVAFNLAKSYLRDRPAIAIPKTSDVHSYVSDQFELHPDPDQKSVGRKLKRLRKFRNQADYATFFPGLPNFTTASITLAEEIISILCNFSRGEIGD